jgi:hypothetical protein
MWGYIGDASNEDMILGEVEGSKTILFPHLHFKLGTNNDQIVSVSVITDVRAASCWFYFLLRFVCTLSFSN